MSTQEAPVTWHEDIRRLEDKINTILSQMMRREEIEAQDNRRVTIEVFQTTMMGVGDRITKLEASPQRVLGWLSLGIGCLGSIGGFVAIATTIVIAIVTHH